MVSGSATICNGSSTVIQAALTGGSPWKVVWSDGLVQNVAVSPATRVVSPVLTSTYTATNLSDAECVASIEDMTGNATVTVVACPP